MPQSQKPSDCFFQPGDIGLSTSNDWLSKVIKFFTSLQTKKATKSHAFNFIGDGMIVEALASISIREVKKYDSPRFTEVDVYRLPLSTEDQRKLRIGLLERINKAYGWLKLPLFALDAMATKLTSLFGRKEPVFIFSKYFGISNIPVCSQLVVWSIHKFTSYEMRDSNGLKINWKIVSPDYLEDLLKLPHNGAVKIFSKTS